MKTKKTLQIKNSDKLIHFIFFLIFAVIWSIAYKIKNIEKTKILSILLFGILFGIITEALQHFLVYGRNGNFYDVIADLFGIIVGTAIYLAFTIKS